MADTPDTPDPTPAGEARDDQPGDDQSDGTRDAARGGEPAPSLLPEEPDTSEQDPNQPPPKPPAQVGSLSVTRGPQGTAIRVNGSNLGTSGIVRFSIPRPFSPTVTVGTDWHS